MKLRGRDADFHEYFAAERVALQRFAGFLTGDPAAAADLAQEAFVRLYQRWGSLDRDPGPYLRRIVVNLIRSEHRKAKVRALHPIVQPPPSPSHGERVDEWLSLARALRVLPPVRRAVVVLRFYEDRTEQQIADLLDRPLNTVKSDLRRALAQLRDALQTKEGERA
jgi:RNA polymerase sigma-70 factor (sigma-E family)